MYPRYNLTQIEATYPDVATWAKGPTVLPDGNIDHIDFIEVSPVLSGEVHAWLYFRDTSGVGYKVFSARAESSLQE